MPGKYCRAQARQIWVEFIFSVIKSSFYSGDDYLVVGIKNRKVAGGAGTYKHTAGRHQKPEKQKMSVSRVVSFQSVNYHFFHIYSLKRKYGVSQQARGTISRWLVECRLL